MWDVSNQLRPIHPIAQPALLELLHPKPAGLSITPLTGRLVATPLTHLLVQNGSILLYLTLMTFPSLSIKSWLPPWGFKYVLGILQEQHPG